MSDLVVVPRWVLDALADSGDPATQDANLRFRRWQAHVSWNPAMFANITAELDRVRAELQQVAAILRGDDVLQRGTTGLQAVDAGEHGRRAEAELAAERRESRLLPNRD